MCIVIFTNIHAFTTFEYQVLHWEQCLVCRRKIAGFLAMILVVAFEPHCKMFTNFYMRRPYAQALLQQSNVGNTVQFFLRVLLSIKTKYYCSVVTWATSAARLYFTPSTVGNMPAVRRFLRDGSRNAVNDKGQSFTTSQRVHAWFC